MKYEDAGVSMLYDPIRPQTKSFGGGGLSLTLIEKFRIKVLVEAHKRETVPGIGSFGAEAVSVKLRKRTPGIEYYN